MSADFRADRAQPIRLIEVVEVVGFVEFVGEVYRPSLTSDPRAARAFKPFLCERTGRAGWWINAHDAFLKRQAR